MLGKILLVHFEFGTVVPGIHYALKRKAAVLKEVGIGDLAFAAEKYQPSVCIFFHPWMKNFDIYAESISKIGCHKILWSMEDPWEIDYVLQHAGMFSQVISQDKNAAEYIFSKTGKGVHVPHAIDPEVHKPSIVPYEYRSDICFVGAAYPNRLKFFREVLPQLQDQMVTIIGTGWEFLPNTDHQRIINTGCSGQDYVNYINGAKININLHRLTDELTQSNNNHVEASSPNNRFFEIWGCQAFQLVDNVRMPEMGSYYPKLEIFNSPQECVDKAKYFLIHDEERKELARLNHEYTLAHHTNDNRVVELIAPLI